MTDGADKELQQQIAQLQKEKKPERDLWPGIEMALIARKRWQMPWSTVAAVVVCIAAGWTWLSSSHQGNTPMIEIVAELDALHRHEMTELKATFKNTAALTTNWSEQLGDMEHAAEAIKVALKNDPQNITLLKMLSDVYQKEVNLLKTVHTPAIQNPDMI
jgi:hypothetical protein